MLCIFFFILFETSTSDANDNNLRQEVGIGALTCSEFTKNVNKSSYLEDNLYSWVSGYVTAYNHAMHLTNGAQIEIRFLTKEYVLNEINTLCKHNIDLPLSYLVETHILNDLPKN